MRILVYGATGRMGRAVIRLAGRDPHALLVGAVTRSGHPLLGLDAGEQAGIGRCDVMLSNVKECFEAVDVVIDFSTAQAFDGAVQLARQLNAALVSGTTGLSVAQHSQLNELGRDRAVLWASNMSPAMALLQQLVSQAAAALPNADIEIVEAHHRHKVDAPSGSAWALARAAAAGRQQTLDHVVNCRRADTEGPRKTGEIGLSVLRGGSVVGDHRVCLYLDGESLELAHYAQERDIFARGALRVARWLLRQPAGCYQLAQMVQGV